MTSLHTYETVIEESKTVPATPSIGSDVTTDELKVEAVAGSSVYTIPEKAAYAVEEAPVKPLKRVEIGIRFRIDQIADIDTVAQTYHVISVLDMDWVASEIDIQNANDDSSTYVPKSVPRIDPRNIVEKETNYKPWANGNLNKLVEKDGVYYNLRRIEYHCVWTDTFDVENFPFDVQDLTFVFQSREFNKTQSRLFVPSHLFPTFFRIEETYLAVADWEFKTCDAYVQQLDWRAMVGKKSVTRRVTPRMCFRIQARRRSYPILMRVVFWMFLLGLISFFMFAIDPIDGVADRLAFSVTMVLALVAFQFVLSEIIPKVPYMTLVDKYNLFIFILLLLITGESSIIGYYGWVDADFGIDQLKYFDKIVSIIYLVSFLLIHVYYYFKAKAAILYEDSKIGMEPNDIQELLKDNNAPSYKKPSVLFYHRGMFEASNTRFFHVPGINDRSYYKEGDDDIFEYNKKTRTL